MPGEETFTYNQTIEYIDGTRDLNFEAAQRWARAHGTSFKEDVSKREPYSLPHEETHFDPETGNEETRTVITETLKRFWVIGDEPVPYVPPEPAEEEKIAAAQSQMRSLRDSYISSTQGMIDRYNNQLAGGYETTDSEEVYKQLLVYMQYLREYPDQENWWEEAPKTFEEFIVEE